MALVTCPECQKQISDTSAHCIGCGAELKKCPECGNLLTKTAAFCANCGFSISEEKAEEAEEEREEIISSEVGAQRLIKHFDDFRGENPGIKGSFWYNHKGISLFTTLFSSVFLIIVLGFGFIGTKFGGTESVFNVYQNIPVLILADFALMLLVLSPVGSITNAVECIHIPGRFYEYCEKNGIDLFKYTTLATYIIPARVANNNKDTRPYYLSVSKDALYYAAHPEERKKYKIYTIIITAVSVVLLMSAGAMAIVVMAECLIASALGMSLGIAELAGSLPAIALYVVLGITIVFGIVCAIVTKKCFSGKRDAWINEQMAAAAIKKEESGVETVEF